MENIEILKNITKYLIPAITFLLGLIVKHYFELYKNKIPKLKYNINKSFLGASVHDQSWGKVDILYNDAEVKNLYMCNLNLVNTSNKDFSNLEITVWSDLDSPILVGHAYKPGHIERIDFTEKYYEECKNLNEHNQKLLWSQRPFYLPVVNRDDNITFSCLVTNEKGQEPNIYLSCDHPGLKIEANFVEPPLYWGENRDIGALWGLLLSAILALPFIYYIESKIIVVSIVFLLGTFCLLPGILFLKVARSLRKLIR